jgi:hypothetical protein
MREAVHVAQPRQGVVRAVRDLGPPDEPFEQPNACGEDLLFFAGGAFDGDPDLRQPAERNLAVALSRASA